MPVSAKSENDDVQICSPAGKLLILICNVELQWISNINRMMKIESGWSINLIVRNDCNQETLKTSNRVSCLAESIREWGQWAISEVDSEALALFFRSVLDATSLKFTFHSAAHSNTTLLKYLLPMVFCSVLSVCTGINLFGTGHVSNTFTIWKLHSPEKRTLLQLQLATLK